MRLANKSAMNSVYKCPPPRLRFKWLISAEESYHGLDKGVNSLSKHQLSLLSGNQVMDD